MSALDEKLLWICRFMTVCLPVFLILGAGPTDVALTGTALLFLGHCWVTRDWAWLRQPWVKVAVFLWLWLLVVSITAFQKEVAFSRGILWVRFFVFAAALQVWVLDRRWLRIFLLITGVAVAFSALDTIFQYFVGHDVFGIARPAGGMRLTGPSLRIVIGIYMAKLMYLPLLPALLWSFRNRRPALRWVILGAALVVLVAINFSGERMALLLALLGLFASALLLRPLRWPLFGALLVGAVVVGGLIATRPVLFQREVVQTRGTVENISASPYGQIWRNALSIVSHYPIMGVGGKNYRYVCDKKGIAIAPSNTARCATHPHNIYLEWLVDTGVVGLIGFIAMIACWGRVLVGSLRSGRGMLWASGGAVAMLLELWPLGPTASFFNNWSGAFVWICLGAALAGVSVARGGGASPDGRHP